VAANYSNYKRQNQKKKLENTKLYKAKQINTINEHNNQL